MKEYLKNTFDYFDSEFGISAAQKVEIQVRGAKGSIKTTVKKIREDLSARLERLGFTESEMDAIFPSLYSYCDRALHKDLKQTQEQLALKIKALRGVLQETQGLVRHQLLPADASFYQEVISRTKSRLESHEWFFKKVYSPKRGPKSNINQDIDIYHLGLLTDRALKAKNVKKEKGDTPRAIALQLLQSMGFDHLSGRGKVTVESINDAIKRGHKNLQKMFSSLDPS